MIDVERMKRENKALLNKLANTLPKLLEIAGASAKASVGDMKPTTIITCQREAALST